MDRLHSMGVFIAVAEEEGFAAAARRLNMSPPAVTRTIAALEDHLGVKLLTRTTRFVRATDAGQRYLESARRILAEADEADEAAAGVHAAPRGQLAVTAPVLFGSMHVMPGIVEFLARYPEVSVKRGLLTGLFQPAGGGHRCRGPHRRIARLDHARHSGRLCQARHLCRARLSDPASTAERTARPGWTDDHSSASPISTGLEWRLGNGKQQISVKVQPRLTVTNNAAAIEAALMGFGITRLMSYQVAAHLAAGKLVRLFPEYEPPASA